ncbi:hypothetical protein J6O48_12340 [bacterium]|nr:hypothetical protein [bacterium]
MKVNLDKINFGDRISQYNIGKHCIEEYYNDSDIITKRIEYDEFKRDVDSKTFDIQGNITDHQHKEYFENETEKGVIETFKNSSQEYTRKAYTKIENGLKHHIDNYNSKTNPKSNYINDFIYDMSNKLIKIISNGKELKF